MVNFIIGIAFFAIALFIVYRKYKVYKSQMNFGIPGMQATDEQDGNLGDIQNEGSLSEFLRKLHQKHGPIVSFWEGKTLAVSTASPQLFEEQKDLFRLPDTFNELFRPLCGNECFAIGDAERAVRYREIYDPFFNEKGNKTFYECFSEISVKYAEKWKPMTPDDQLPLMETMMQATMLAIVRCLFGNYFKDHNKFEKFRLRTEECFRYLQVPPEAGTLEEKKYKESIKGVRGIVADILETRRKESRTESEPIFIDVLLDEDMTEEQRIGDALVFLSAGYTTTGQLLTNIIYMLSIHEPAQETLYQELVMKLSEGPITMEEAESLKYMRQVIKETLRYIPGADFVFRTTDKELTLGKSYVVPKGSNLYQALCVCFDDSDFFTDPDCYAPDRFNEEHSKGRHPYAFKPFGFSGRRHCPGKRFTFLEATVMIAEWMRRYSFRLVPGQTVTYVHGFTAKPTEEIWVALTPRKAQSILD